MMTVGIIGTGLVGGSIGLRAREVGWRVIGFDTNAEAAEEARALGVIDEIVTREHVDERADVIVIAAHIGGTLAELERLRSAPVRKARLIIDISSVKLPIVEGARGLKNFVPTHPMAGRERSGPSAAVPNLFEGKTWLYVPSGDRELDCRAVEFIGAFGAIPVEADAVEHDRIVALTSHLPQLFATVFARRLGASAQPFMGPAAKELQRLSGSSSAMWHDILLFNRENLCAELQALSADLKHAADQLKAGRVTT